MILINFKLFKALKNIKNEILSEFQKILKYNLIP